MKSLVELMEGKATPEIYDKKEVESCNIAGNKLMLATEEGSEHVYLKPVNSKKFYDIVNRDSFQYPIDYHNFRNEMPESLASKLWLVLNTFEGPDKQSRINNMIRHYNTPVITDFGMFFNSEAEAKAFIKDAKKDYNFKVNSEMKKFKSTPMTVSQYIKFCEGEYKGEFYHYTCNPLKFIHWDFKNIY